MLFRSPRKLLSEAAAADFLDPAVSGEVKDVVEDLNDTLTNNVEEVKEEDKTTNGGIPTTVESASMLESERGYGRARYLLKLEDVMAIQETEGEAAAEAEAQAEAPAGETPAAPTPAECEAHEPEACDVVEKIAANNGVDPDQVAVVITSESVTSLMEHAILESKAGRDIKTARKLGKINETIKNLKNNGIKVVRT